MFDERNRTNGKRLSVGYSLLLALLGVMVLLGYVNPAGAQVDPKTFVQQFYESFAQDLHAALDMLSDDIEWILPDSPVDKKGRPEIAWLGRRQGRAQVEEFFQLLGEQVQMFEFTPREFYAEGNTVFVVLHERSICLRTKIAYTLDFVHKLVVRDEKIVSLENYLPTAPIVAAFRGDKSYPSWVILAPEEGEIVRSGSDYTVRWEAHPQAVKFNLYFSTNGGKTWHLIESDLTDTSYDWKVPIPKRNEMKCLLKVIGYDSFGKKMDSAKSYFPFTLEVVKLVSPDGGESLKSGDKQPITWEINGTSKPVIWTKLYYSQNGGRTWKLLATLPGDELTYDWAPLVGERRSNCKVKVVLLDENAREIGSDVSDDPFTIEP